MLLQRQPSAAPAPFGSFLVPPSPGGVSREPPPPPPSPSRDRVHGMLARYVSTIRREDFLPRLNHVLRARVGGGGGDDRSGGDRGGASRDIVEYYASRPELRDYTLGVELDRDLDYTLVLPSGEAVTDKGAIRAHFRDGGGCDGDGGGGPPTFDTKELLIRSANQSLLADALIALTGSEDVLLPSSEYSSPSSHTEDEGGRKKPGLILPGPVLSMTSVVEKCHFTVDLSRGRVEAICVLAISVPDGDRRLVLARAILIANFQPPPPSPPGGEEGRIGGGEEDGNDGGKKKKKKRRPPPPLQYVMQMVKAHHYPTSRALRDAATSLANDQDSLSVQSAHESTTDNGPTGKGSSGKLPPLLHRPFSLFR